jgi:hypothetical protein
MTQLPVTSAPPPKPTSVALSELTIAAGLAGRSLTLSFQSFPALVLCQLWKYSIRYAGPNTVRNVYTQADVRKLAKEIDQVRLVLVHTAGLCNLVSWTIQTSALVLEAGAEKPALFHCVGPRNAEDDPGATLVLHGDGAEHAAVTQWLLMAGNDHPDWEAIPPAWNIQVEPAIDSRLMDLRLPTAGTGSIRNCQVLDALLAGATLVRALEEATAPPILITGIADYELVRRFLQTRPVAGADDAFDPLAADMVSRANVYMTVKYGVGSDNPFVGDCSTLERGERPGRELVTRREVSDLGNVRSRMVRRLIAFLQHQPDGYDRFRQMGLVRRPPGQDAWRRAGINDLIAYLRPWSAKQLRTHFDLLRRLGMITAEREHGNAPWQYTLPEDIAARSSPYRDLPRIEDPAVSPAAP